MFASDLAEWPFIYLKAMGAYPAGVSGADPTGAAAVFGVLFYDGRRAGPICFGGAVKWSNKDALADHWMLYYAMTGEKGRFQRQDGPVKLARPTAEGAKY